MDKEDLQSKRRMRERARRAAETAEEKEQRLVKRRAHDKAKRNAETKERNRLKIYG